MVKHLSLSSVKMQNNRAFQSKIESHVNTSRSSPLIEIVKKNTSQTSTEALLPILFHSHYCHASAKVNCKFE